MTRTRLQVFARRFWDGSEILAREIFEATAAWVRKGRRDDLKGIAAVLGCVVRALLVLLGLYLLWRVIRAFPNLLWVIVPLWCWQALRATRPAEEEKPAEEEPPAAPDTESVRTLLTDLIGDRPGVHLSTVLDHLQKQGQGEGWEVADLRSRLEALGVPVRRSVKVNRRVAYGVHRDDLTAPSPEAVTEKAA